MKIGFIGLGKMGVPMAENLLRGGYPLLVYNRTVAKADGLVSQGAELADSPIDLIEKSEVIIVMVADDEAVRTIFNDFDKLLSPEKGKIVINMSTVSPGISRKMNDRLTRKGFHYLDAPVSGSLKQAQEGSLVIMVGGDLAIFENVKPILNSLGKLAMRIGEVGTGNVAKLAINSLLSFHAQGLAEAINFASERGIATADLLELINQSALGNIFMKIKGDAILQENFNPVFALKHIAKDLRLAKAEGIDSPLANAALSTFTAAEATLGEEDIIAIIKQC